MTLYPTEQWLVEYERHLNDSDALSSAGAGWGVDFDGDVYFVITDVPVEETALGDLPEAALEGVPEQLQGQLADVPLEDAAELIDDDVRDHLPERSSDLLRQVEEDVHDGTIYAYLALYDGGCEEVAVVGDPAERDVGFVLRGDYETWGGIVDGEVDPIAAVMGGDLEVEGDMQTVLEYSDATMLLGEIAAEVESTHLF